MSEQLLARLQGTAAFDLPVRHLESRAQALPSAPLEVSELSAMTEKVSLVKKATPSRSLSGIFDV